MIAKAAALAAALGTCSAVEATAVCPGDLLVIAVLHVGAADRSHPTLVFGPVEESLSLDCARLLLRRSGTTEESGSRIHLTELGESTIEGFGRVLEHEARDSFRTGDVRPVPWKRAVVIRARQGAVFSFHRDYSRAQWELVRSRFCAEAESDPQALEGFPYRCGA